MALILRYFTEFGNFCVKLVEDVAVKKFTFTISSPDEFLFTRLGSNRSRRAQARAGGASPSPSHPLTTH